MFLIYIFFYKRTPRSRPFSKLCFEFLIRISAQYIIWFSNRRRPEQSAQDANWGLNFQISNMCSKANTSMFSLFILHAAVKAIVKAQSLHPLHPFTARLGIDKWEGVSLRCRCVRRLQ